MNGSHSGRIVRKGEQAPWIVPDGFWECIELVLFKVERPYREGCHDSMRRSLCS